MLEVSRRKLISYLKTRGISDTVLEVMAQIPRHEFVQNALSLRCYENVALPIGEGQTISQPYMTAKMTDLLQLKPTDKVLEIGTGCGYQTAVLAMVADRVFSVERIKKLQLQALRRLKALDLYNVQLKHGDGWEGWRTNAPFDAIIVTAAPFEIPNALLEQLNDNGRLVIPVGYGDKQVLHKVTRIKDKYKIEKIEDVKFVPLISGDLE